MRGGQQYAVPAPYVRALVEVAAGEAVGVGGAQDEVTAQGVELVLIGKKYVVNEIVPAGMIWPRRRNTRG